MSGLSPVGWETSIVDGFAGLNAFFNQIMPILFPLLVMLFLGFMVVALARKVSVVVS